MNPSAEYNFTHSQLGLTFETERFLCLFGNVDCELDLIKKIYPQLSLLRLRQTHSDIVIQAEYNPHSNYENLNEADAHYSAEKNQALLISTADCMPIMIYCIQTNRVAAVHAGWRGVVNKIIEKTLKKLIETGSTKKDFEIFIGPSIQQNSFEVDEDVYKLIKSATHSEPEENYCEKRNNKYHLNLPIILITQIKSLAPISKITISSIDTKTNLDYHSYRRGKQKPQRNLSFITLK